MAGMLQELVVGGKSELVWREVLNTGHLYMENVQSHYEHSFYLVQIW